MTTITLSPENDEPSVIGIVAYYLGGGALCIAFLAVLYIAITLTCVEIHGARACGV
jgi:hypothetical protein